MIQGANRGGLSPLELGLLLAQEGVDSSGFQPTLAQVRAAYAQGIRVWGGYLPGPGIYSGDTQAYFATLKAGGMITIAFWSGDADPAQQKALGLAWGVDHICLDVENGIRGDGPWVQPALNVAGGGLYGSPSVFTSRTAVFFIEASYYGVYPNYIDPQATWRGPAPSVPHGIQWAGSVSAFGGGVDRMWLDDWFVGATPQPTQGDQMAYYMTPTTHQPNEPLLWLCADLQLGPKRPVWNPDEENAYNGSLNANIKDLNVYTVPRFAFDAMPGDHDLAADVTVITAELTALAAQIAATPPGTGGGVDPNTKTILDLVTKIEKSLQGA